MRKFLDKWGMVMCSGLAGVLVATSIARCGSDTTKTYVQIERLGRPGINEALVVTPEYLSAFNAIGPSVDLTPPASQVVAEAAAVLGALYLGACYVYGVLGLTDPDDTATPKPAFIPCKDTNGLSLLSAANMFTGGSVANGPTASAQAQATTYANKVAGYFLPDVLRIDTSGTSGYGAQYCAAAAEGKPLLCGGRTPTDDTIDITYKFLLGGDPTVNWLSGALTDGVSYAGGGGNPNQGHTPLRADFPYVPRPNG